MRAVLLHILKVRYFNEEEGGNAIAKSGIPREEIFLTAKVWIEHYGNRGVELVFS